MSTTITTRQREDMAQKMYDILLGQKNDPSQTSGFGPYAHGNTGLFSTPGVDQAVFSAILQPQPGLADSLRALPAGTSAPEDYGGFEVPLFTTITGVTEGASESRNNQRATPCGDPPLAGLVKACVQTAPYGLFSGRIALDIRKVGRMTNYAEPTDLRVLNGGIPADRQVPSQLFGGMGPGFFTELGKKMFEAGVSFRRYVNSIVYDASPSNNNAGLGYKEYVGVDLLANTGKVDAINGQACPRMDSIIRNFNSGKVNVATSGLVQQLDDIMRHIFFRSTRMGLGEPSIKLVMRQELFDEIVKYWPIQYYTEALTQIAAFTNGRVTFNASETAQMRDDMRQRQFLPIRGRMMQVTLDDTIAETAVGGQAGFFKSDIYILTDAVMGGSMPVMYWEAFNQANRQAVNIEAYLAGQTWTTDGGMFRWYVNHRNGCFDLIFEGEWRLIQRTPYLCARLQNVAYAPLQPLDSWDPSSSYFLNGGRTNTNEQKWYTDWSLETPVVVGRTS